MIGRLGRRDW